MADKRVRLNISVSFASEEKEIYEYAKDKPNSSYYIKQLIKEDMERERKKGSNTIQEVDMDDITNMLF